MFGGFLQREWKLITYLEVYSNHNNRKLPSQKYGSHSLDNIIDVSMHDIVYRFNIHA